MRSAQGKSLWKQAVTLPSGRNTVLSIPLSGKLTDDDPGHLILHCKDDPCPADNEWFFPPVQKADRSVRLFSSVRFPALKAALDASGIRFTESEEWPAQSPDMLFVGDSPLSDANAVRGMIDDMLHAGTSVALLYQNTPFMHALFEQFGAVFKNRDKSAAESAQLQSIDLEHPVFREYRDLGSASWFDLLFFNIPEIKLPEGAHVIAEWEGGIPAIAELPRNGGKLFFFAFAPDPRQTNFQTSGHFLPFFRELLEYSAVSASKRVRFTAADKTVRTPDGELDLRTPGIHRIGSAVYCVNADRTESETAVIPDGFSVVPGERKTADTSSAAKKAFPFDAANPMLLFACAIAFLLAESGISNRTAL